MLNFYCHSVYCKDLATEKRTQIYYTTYCMSRDIETDFTETFTTFKKLKEFIHNSGYGYLARKGFFKKRDCIWLGNRDDVKIDSKDEFKGIELQFEFEEYEPSIYWILKNLDASDAIEYLQSKGMKCPFMNK